MTSIHIVDVNEQLIQSVDLTIL